MNSPNRLQQIEALFHATLERDAADRAAFLAQACAADSSLLGEVQALLAAHEGTGDFSSFALGLPAQVGAEEQATALLPKPLTVATPRTINQYKILSLLGKGGMGEVWLAEDTRLKRQVALKLLPAEFTHDAERLRRFEQEALAISALNHPNIITIHEIGESAAGRFIVMELVAGRTLRTQATAGVTLDSLLEWGNQLAQALRVAHAAGITHRDIKPDNIMVREDGYVKVLDFGLARLTASRENLADADPLAGTQSGMLLGTVKYMSPEQARGEKVASATDIFALGVLLYELATGRHPFNAPTLLGTLQQITSETPRPPAQLNPAIPAALDALIQRMLAKSAHERPSAAQVEMELRQLGRQSDSTSGRTSGAFAPTPAPTAPLRHTVGRVAERAELRATFQTVQAGRGQLLCLAGEPGLGKTTLVEEFLAELTAQDSGTIARGRCSERLAGTEAYLPLLEALESLLNIGPSVALTLKQLAPTWYAQVVPLSGESEAAARLLSEVRAASQERMKRELGAFLQAVARLRPLVLFFDDLHWADVSTIDLLSFLAGKFDTLNALIVVTYRPSDMLLTKHPFLQIKPDLQARGLCRELQLEFLNEAEIEQYLALEFPGHHFPTEFPKLVHSKTEGSPLFMADLVRYLRDHNVIAQTKGAWTLAQTLPDIERELPESVRGMIERKIAQLSEEDRKLLVAASVQGYDFDSAVVAKVLELDADEVEERLEKLERVFAFVKLTGEAEFPNRALSLRYRFVHVLYQNALYASLRVTRKASLSAAVAQALEGFYGAQSASVANDLAVLWDVARKYGRAADYFLQAARNAAQINAHREATQLARRGLEALQRLPETPERDRQELGLQLTLGRSLQSVQNWATPEAGAAFKRARKLCERLGDDPMLFAALFGVLFYHLAQGDFEIALELGEQLLQMAEERQDPSLLVAACYALGGALNYQGEFVSARLQLTRALALDRQEYHQTYLTVHSENIGITSRRVLTICLWILGYPDQALALANEAITLAERMLHPLSLAGAHHYAGFLYLMRRDWQSCERQFEKGMSLAEEYALGGIINYAKASRMIAMAYLSPTEEVIERVRQIVDSLRVKGVALASAYLLTMIAELWGMIGRPVEAQDALYHALDFANRTGERFWEAEIWRVKGDVSLKADVNNSQMEAEACYRKAIEIAQRQSAKSLELRATTSLARLWKQQEKVAEARRMLAEIYGWFTEGFDTVDLKEARALLDELQQQDAQVSNPAISEGGVLSVEEIADARAADTTSPPPSIAVLPFVNISNDPDNEYFCDGLAEELLNALSKIEALRVAARTSAFSFKGKETDIREIGQKLNVATVLEGSVRKAGNRLRITAQLIKVADGYHLWSEKYDRQLEDIFDIQDEIALAIVAALKVKLLGTEKAAVLKRYTDNTEAYQLYLLGRFHYSKFTAESWEKAIDYFEQAIAKEPNYAPAYAGLVSVYIWLWLMGYLAPATSAAKAKAAATRALALDDTQAECHLALAQSKVGDWDWSGAEREIKRALELNPNCTEAYLQYGSMLALQGRSGEALVAAQRALELDPLSLEVNLKAGFIFRWVGQNDRQREQGRKLIELEPNFYGGHHLLALTAWHAGQYEQAISEYQTTVALSGSTLSLAQLGCLYGVVGEREKAQQVRNQLQELSAQRYVPRVHLALVYAGLGELDRAFELIEQAYEEHEIFLLILKTFAALIPGINADPRFADLLRRIGLPQSNLWQRK